MKSYIIIDGIKISGYSLAAATFDILQRYINKSGGAYHLCNAYTLSLIKSNSYLEKALKNNCVNLADGLPLAILVNRFKKTRAVRGSDLFFNVLSVLKDYKAKHFLIGGKDETINLMIENINKQLPECLFAGSISPEFKEHTDSEIETWIQTINKNKADIIWLGLGTPKQDIYVEKMAKLLPNKIFIPIGAAFNFWAGTTKEAPKWIQHTGLEWAFRLAMEPRRLFKRYLFGNLGFLWLICKGFFLGNIRWENNFNED